MAALVDSLAYSGEVPWHRLGTQVPGLMLAAEALNAGGLNWTVEKQPVYLGNGQSIPRAYATVRTDRGTALGVVGEKYRPVQNAEAFEVMDKVIAGVGWKYEVVGALDEGREVFLLAKKPEGLIINGDDVVESFVLLQNSHDGRSPVRILPTDVRVVCNNTLRAALSARDINKTVSLKHTANVMAGIAEATRAWDTASAALKRQEEAIVRMAAFRPSMDQVGEYQRFAVDLISPVPYLGVELSDEEKAAKVKRSDRERDEISGLISSNYTEERSRFGGDSAWLLYNSVSGYADHQLDYKGQRKEQNHFTSVFTGRSDEIKQAAFTEASRLAA